MKNIDKKTVDDFGKEWSVYSQEELTTDDLKRQFNRYFTIFRWDKLPENPIGFDMGCGSGRWAKLMAPRVSELHCIDASKKALAIAERNLEGFGNCKFLQASFENIPLADNSMDFCYSLGVLHAIPDPLSGIKSCVDKIKPGGQFLIYLYYAFENKPFWFKVVWKCSDIMRHVISRLPFKIKLFISRLIAFSVYYPLSKFSYVLEKFGVNVNNVPLSQYRDLPFYTMRTDALDRFGTRLEKRFTKTETFKMLEKAGLEKIIFSDEMPYWCALGFKKHIANNEYLK